MTTYTKNSQGYHFAFAVAEKPEREMVKVPSYPFHRRRSINRPSISVVIPTLNEEANLPYVLPLIPDWVDEVLLVDGRSTDRTIEVARELRPDVKIVLEKKKGKGAAMRAGFAAANGDIIVVIDADGSNDPAEISGFVGALQSGADYAKGTRFMQGAGTSDMSFLRKLGNWGFVTLTKILFGGSYTDLCYGYNAFWRDTLPVLALDGDGFEIETIMNIRALRKGLKVAEVPSFEYDRIHGVSRLQTFPDGWRVLKAILREASAYMSDHLVQHALSDTQLIPATGMRSNLAHKSGQAD